MKSFKIRLTGGIDLVDEKTTDPAINRKSLPQHPFVCFKSKEKAGQSYLCPAFLRLHANQSSTAAFWVSTARMMAGSNLATRS